MARQHTAREKRVAECDPAQGARDKAPLGETSIGECAACFKATSGAFWGRCGQQAVAWAGHRRWGVAGTSARDRDLQALSLCCW